MDFKKFLNFLYIVEDFPPAGMQLSIRALEISKRIIKKNIFPIILAKGLIRYQNFNYSLINEIPASLQIYRTSFIKFKNKVILKFLDFTIKLDFYLEWIPFGYLKAKRILRKDKNIKFIYSSGPPFYIHILGYLLKRKFNVPLVLEYRDPWSFNPYDKKFERWLSKKINLVLERKILRSANLVITISPALTLFLKKKFPFIKNQLIVSIPNGLNLFNLVDNLKNKNNQEIVFTFAGTIYRKRSIVPLFEIISHLKKENFFEDFKFLIKIFGNFNKKKLESLIRILKIEDLILLGDFIPRSRALIEISKSNMAIHVGEQINYPTIAFKVWDYLGCKKKILYLGSENSYTAEFLKKNNFGIVIPINNLNKGKNLLKKLINDIKDNKFTGIIDEKQLLKYTWDYRATKFEQAITKYFLI